MDSFRETCWILKIFETPEVVSGINLVRSYAKWQLKGTKTMKLNAMGPVFTQQRNKDVNRATTFQSNFNQQKYKLLHRGEAALCKQLATKNQSQERN